ncbi:hypothetical protein Tco_0924899 [Tanacetum coccineum]|uniref:Uncharacterized protein n=1 Tax=Tanacetum coccineum TaxID=301880 RepID=A0ABQ5D6M2_9ASTR
MYVTDITNTTSHKRVSDQRPPNQIRRDIYPFVLGKLEHSCEMKSCGVVRGRYGVAGGDERRDGGGDEDDAERVTVVRWRRRWVARIWPE